MKLATTRAQLIEMIREELVLEGPRYIRTQRAPDKLYDTEDETYVSPDGIPSAEIESKEDFDAAVRDQKLANTTVSGIPVPEPVARGVDVAADKLETDPIAPIAGAVLAADAGQNLRAIPRGGSLRALSTDAVTTAQDALDALPKNTRPVYPGAPNVDSTEVRRAKDALKVSKDAAMDAAEWRGAQVDDIEIPGKERPGPLPDKKASTKKGLRSKLDDLAKKLEIDKEEIRKVKEFGEDATKKMKNHAKKLQKRVLRNKGVQVALRQGNNPAVRNLVMRIAAVPGTAVAGAALEALGAGIAAAEITDLVLGDKILDVLPTWKGGKNISWTDAVNAENWRGLDPSSVRNRDRRSKKQATNPKKGYNKYYDPEGKGVDKYGRVKEGTNKMNNLDRIIEELITEEIEEHYNETNELGRWSELAGLSETSGMAAGSVGGAAGGSSPSFWGAFGPDRDNEDDELEEAQDNSFSEAGEEIEKKGTEGVFTAKAKKAGMGVQAYADKVLQKDSNASTKTKRQAAFAKGAATVARENK